MVLDASRRFLNVADISGKDLNQLRQVGLDYRMDSVMNGITFLWTLNKFHCEENSKEEEEGEEESHMASK